MKSQKGQRRLSVFPFCQDAPAIRERMGPQDGIDEWKWSLTKKERRNTATKAVSTCVPIRVYDERTGGKKERRFSTKENADPSPSARSWRRKRWRSQKMVSNKASRLCTSQAKERIRRKRQIYCGFVSDRQKTERRAGTNPGRDQRRSDRQRYGTGRLQICLSHRKQKWKKENL